MKKFRKRAILFHYKRIEEGRKKMKEIAAAQETNEKRMIGKKDEEKKNEIHSSKEKQGMSQMGPWGSKLRVQYSSETNNSCASRPAVCTRGKCELCSE